MHDILDKNSCCVPRRAKMMGKKNTRDENAKKKSNKSYVKEVSKEYVDIVKQCGRKLKEFTDFIKTKYLNKCIRRKGLSNGDNKNFSYCYIENFLKNNDLTQIKSELKNYDQKLNNSLDNYRNVYRYNTPISSIKIRNILESYSYTNKIRASTNNNKIYLANNFPIEYRKYVSGSFMKKHRDVLIYKKPQYECILTLSNSTDSFTILGNKQIRSKPNSLIIVKAQGIEHEVTKVNEGERYFLKFIFTETDQFSN